MTNCNLGLVDMTIANKNSEKLVDTCPWIEDESKGLFFNLIENGEGYVVDRIIKLLNIANNQLAMINGENSLMIYLVASHDDWQIEIRCGKNGINPLDANIEVEVGYRSVEDAIMQIGGQLVIGG